jgi:putative PIN family toxin of toxin-antitoxin system
MRVILDANVAIAAVAARGLCEAVVELCLERHVIVFGETVLRDIADKLRRKLKLPEAVVSEFLAVLRLRSEIVVPDDVPPGTCRDPDDHAVLGLALPGRAEVIVSGDQDLLVLKTFKGCRILSPREFWEMERAGGGGEFERI